ncbi:MAG: SpoIIE family protein phosphatase [Spirochaetia bacterium]|nr:SpoIIE family protein phosphatase [Spirochaetia bacterium]
MEVMPTETEIAKAGTGRYLSGALRLLKSRAVETGDIVTGLREICDSAIHALLAERITIWNAAGNGSRLYCMHRLVAASELHSSGGEMRKDEIPNLCAALESQKIVSVSNIKDSPIFRGFFAGVEQPEVAMLAIPVTLSNRWVGAIIIERLDVNREWSAEEEQFSMGLADVLSRSMEATFRNKVDSIQAVAERARLLQEMSLRASVEADLRSQKLNIERELNLGAAIQEGINVSNLTPWNGISFARSYLPMETISGDYIDLFRRADSLHMVVADVSGHGIPAAFWTMMAKQIFVESIHRSVGPANAFEQINEALVQRIHTSDYLTSAMVRVDTHNDVTYCLAGHPDIVHIDMKSRIASFKTGPGFVLGVAHPAPIPYYTGTFHLSSGDRVLLYTDGITEQTNEKGEQFGADRMLAAVQAHVDQPLQVLLDQIIAAVQEFMGNAVVKDDISILALELSPDWAAFVKIANAGLIAFKAGDFALAESNLTAAHALIPTYPETILALANVTFKIGKKEQAQAYIELYRKIKPSCLRGLSVAGKVYLALKIEKSLDAVISKLELLAALDQRAEQLARRLKNGAQ